MIKSEYNLDNHTFIHYNSINRAIYAILLLFFMINL